MAQGTIYTKVQYAGETTYNELSRVQSCDLKSINNFIYDRGLGEGINAINTYYGPFDANGSVEFNVVDFDFLKHWIGPKSGAGTVGDPYTLTEATSVAASTSALQTFSIERLNDYESTDSVDYMLGCAGTDFNLSGGINEKLICSANFIGQKTGFRTSGQTYTPNTAASFIMINGTWKWGSTPTALSGVREFSISYDNGLIANTRSIESRFINIPLLGTRTYYNRLLWWSINTC